MARKSETDGGTVVETDEAVKPRLDKPRQYRVLVHNDDYTTREFVVDMLRSIFHHSEGEAIRIMLHVHHTGVGIAGVYTRDIASTKIRTVEELARENEFPLRLSMEPEE